MCALEEQPWWLFGPFRGNCCMPTYEYLCQTCSHRFEQWQKMIDDPLEVCPECDGRIRRVFFPAGIVFKGSGFYKTDHRSSSVADSNGQITKSNGDASSESKSAGESKPATTESSASSASTSENKVPATTSSTTKTN
jgi:putative FmdB family regulatory protein